MLRFEIVLGLLAATAAQAQNWFVIPLGTTDDTPAVQNNGFPEKWIVGENGFVAHCSDGRTVWTQVDVGSTADLLSVHEPPLDQVRTGAGAGVVRQE